MFRSTSYVTYPSGQLLEYGSAIRKQDMSSLDGLTMLSEYFDRKGRLIGISHEISGAVPDNQFWWKGRRVSEDQWIKSRMEVLRAVHEKRRKEHGGARGAHSPLRGYVLHSRYV